MKKLLIITALLISAVLTYKGVQKKEKIPNGLKSMRAKKERFKGTGLVHYEKNIDPHLLLLSRYNNDLKLNSVELIEVASKKVIHTWKMDRLERFTFSHPNRFFTTPRSEHYPSTKANHPYLEKNGDLVFHFNERTPLYKVNKCGRLLWSNSDFAYHHSLEKDHEGHYWIPGTNDAIHPIYGEGFYDDFIVKISPQGKVLFRKSVTDILLANNLLNKIYTYDKFVADPLHLNDIEPVVTDGPHWKKGDVFLSLAHLNMLMLYRPSTDELLWWRQERVMHQHDIDIIDDHRISIFNNNRITTNFGNKIVGRNELLAYDFNKDEFSSLHKDIFKREEITTINQGLSHLTNDKGLFVEETRMGRLLYFGSNGKKQWEYINKDKSDKTFILNWSRLLPVNFLDTSLFSSSSCE